MLLSLTLSGNHLALLPIKFCKTRSGDTIHILLRPYEILNKNIDIDLHPQAEFP